MHLPSGPVPGFVCREAGAALGILPMAAKCGFCSTSRRPVDKSRGQKKEQKKGSAQNQETLEGDRRLGAFKKGPG